MNLTSFQKIPSIDGVVNLSSIEPLYFAGLLQSKEAVQSLVKLGITTFVDLKKTDEANGSKTDCEWIRSSNANYFNLPVSDPREDIDYAFNERMREIIESSQGKVLIYCASSNRVGYWFGRYLKEVVGLSKEKCYEYALKTGLASESAISKFKEQIGV